MLFVNETENTVKVAIGKGFMVKPKATIEIDDAYALPRLADNGSRRPAIIEELAPQLKPADLTERSIWLQAPERKGQPKQAAAFPTVESLVLQGVPQGQAEMTVKQLHQAALDALNEKSEEPSLPSKARK